MVIASMMGATAFPANRTILRLIRGDVGGFDRAPPRQFPAGGATVASPWLLRASAWATNPVDFISSTKAAQVARADLATPRRAHRLRDH
jgi:hypothetical protein